MNTKSHLSNKTRAHFNPVRHLTPERLSQALDNFNTGYLKSAALIWDTIERRDDVLQGVASKRKKSIARLDWEILTLEDSPEAKEHKKALEYFYNNLSSTHACDANEQGGLSLLIKQMMDSVGKRYAVHEIVYQPQGGKNLTATFRFVPLWYFENKSGQLRFLKNETDTLGIPLKPGAWMTTKSDGLMESCSVAYLFKHLPLRDWLVYCERNGMPGVKGTTDAQPNSPQWNAAREAVRDFGAEFHALMSSGTNIESIDLSSSGQLPYPALVERMDRAMAALWRGSDLSTLAKTAGTGATVQAQEASILEEDDASLISETLNAQVDRFVLKYLFGVERGKAYIRLLPQNDIKTHRTLELYERLNDLGVPLPLNTIRERLGIPTPTENEEILNTPSN